jgi:molecular chaperone GrpE (heat shock protein)
MLEEQSLELSLLENGLDFILKGIDELYELNDDYEYYPEYPRKDYKYGVLHLFSGFILLLKERLSRHMPELIFQGRMDDVRRKLSNGNELNTVNLDEALERLEIGPQVTFSESDCNLIRKVQKYRNRFEHYKCSANKFEINKVVIEFISLIDNFLINELNIDINSDAVNTTPEIREKVIRIESVYNRIIKNRIDEIDKLGEEKLERFQENREDILEELDREHWREKGCIDITAYCPECDEETLIIYGEFTGVCSNEECNSYSSLKNCDRCGEMMAGYEWEHEYCENCNDEIERIIERSP